MTKLYVADHLGCAVILEFGPELFKTVAMMEMSDTNTAITDEAYHGQSSESSSESEHDLSPPKTKKAKKFTGAATYKTKFNLDWRKEFPFITSVQNDPYRYDVMCFLIN